MFETRVLAPPPLKFSTNIGPAWDGTQDNPNKGLIEGLIRAYDGHVGPRSFPGELPLPRTPPV